jgi:hypothetical protein
LGLPVASAGNQAYSAFSDGSGDNFSVPPRHQTDGQFVYCQSIDGASGGNSKMARFQRPSRKVSDIIRSDPIVVLILEVLILETGRRKSENGKKKGKGTLALPSANSS